MDTQELTNHLRNRIKAAGIKAFVKHYESCGTKYIRVRSPAYDKPLNADQYYQICLIAKVNGCTFGHGMEIDPWLFIKGGNGCAVDQIDFVEPKNA